MKTYHKIQTVYKRNPATKFKTLLEGDYSIPEFEYLKDNLWVFTEKVDGTNIRVQFNEIYNEITYQGKTDKAQLYSGLEEVLHSMFDGRRDKFIDMFKNNKVCLYGEGYGPKIQAGGGKYRKDQSFVLFDVMIEGIWLNRRSVEDIASNLNINVVPIIGEGTLNEMIGLTKQGFLSNWGNFIAEGIVARPKTELCDRMGNRIITKIKHRDFK